MYGTIKLINYLRKQGKEGAESALALDKSACARPWDADEYFAPVLEDDALLSYDWEGDDEEGEEPASSAAPFGKQTLPGGSSGAEALETENAALKAAVQALQAALLADTEVPGSAQADQAKAGDATAADAAARVDDAYFDSYSFFDIHREMLSDKVPPLGRLGPGGSVRQARGRDSSQGLIAGPTSAAPGAALRGEHRCALPPLPRGTHRARGRQGGTDPRQAKPALAGPDGSIPRSAGGQQGAAARQDRTGCGLRHGNPVHVFGSWRRGPRRRCVGQRGRLNRFWGWDGWMDGWEEGRVMPIYSTTHQHLPGGIEKCNVEAHGTAGWG